MRHAKLYNKNNQQPVLVDLSKETDVIDAFCNQYVSESTRRAYSGDLKLWFDFLKENLVHPLEVKPMIVKIYLTSLEQKASVNTRNRYLGALKAFYRWLQENQFIQVNPVEAVKALKGGPEKPTEAFTDEEAKKILESPNVNTIDGNCDRLVLVFLFYLGLRREELGRLRLKDIYSERGQWVIAIVGKGNKSRLLPLSDLVFNEIINYRSRFELMSRKILAKNDFLLQREINKSMTPIHGTTVYRVVQKYSRQNGIFKRVGPHSCRATAISHLLEKSVSARNVADFVGHANINTTLGYDKKRDALKNSAAFQVDFGIKADDVNEEPEPQLPRRGLLD